MFSIYFYSSKFKFCCKHKRNPAANFKIEIEIFSSLPATYTTPKAIYYAWREILKSSTAHRVGYPGE